MEFGYYDMVEESEEEMAWSFWLTLRFLLALATIWDIVTFIPLRIAGFAKETFARY